ncbi:MAG: response regulator [Lentimicrobiaceae bacterium]|nr:response regulator [Lentimicrobiaceae bacterium]
MEKIPPILYAEDNENDVELTLTAFKQCKLSNRIDVVNDGIQVLDYLQYNGKYQNREKEKPVLILLDIKMPKLDGIQALKIIKSDEELKTIPVVMLTSSAMESDLVKSYNLGVNAYVVKPVDYDDFIEAVKKIGSFWAIVNKTV